MIASSSKYNGMFLKAILDTTLQQYTESIEKSTTVVNDSTSLFQKATTEVADLVCDSKMFLESFKGHASSNATKVNATLDCLSVSLQEEKAMFDTVRSDI